MGSIIRVASLFSGCGGLDLGFAGGFNFHGRDYETLPTHVVYANDFDHDAVTCFNANMPKFDEGVICHEGDIRDVNEADVPEFDLLLAGFPCQPFSNAGLRGGVNDKYNRGTLFEECERILGGQLARGHKPSAFVFENVRGILSSKMDDGTPVVEEIERRMRSLGYHVGHRLVRASDYGVPQNRFRVLIIGVDANRYEPFSFDELDNVLDDYGIPSQKAGNHEELLLGSLLLDLSKANNRDDEYWPYTEATQTMINQIGPCERRHPVNIDGQQVGYPSIPQLSRALGKGRAVEPRYEVRLVAERLVGLVLDVDGTPVADEGKVTVNRPVPVDDAAAVELSGVDVVRVLSVFGIQVEQGEHDWEPVWRALAIPDQAYERLSSRVPSKNAEELSDLSVVRPSIPEVLRIGNQHQIAHHRHTDEVEHVQLVGLGIGLVGEIDAIRSVDVAVSHDSPKHQTVDDPP